MKIEHIITTLDKLSSNNQNLAAVKLIYDIRGKGLSDSKNIADDCYFGEMGFGKRVIDILRKDPNWKVFKSNIKKLPFINN